MKFRYFTLVTSLSLLVTSCNKSLNNPTATTPDTTTATKACSTGGTGTTCTAKLSDVDGLQLFPADNSWNQDISAAAVDPYSSQIIAQIGSAGIHPDFGSGLYAGVPIGIPFDVVCGSQAKVKVTFRANAYDGNYGSESDPGPYPIPLNAPIEGNGQGDSHVIVVDKDNDV